MMKIYILFLAGWELEELEEALVRPERSVSVLFPTHGGERAQGHHPARGGEGAPAAQQEWQGLGFRDLQRLRQRGGERMQD